LPFSYLYTNNEIKHHVYSNRGRVEIKEDDTLKLENIRKFYDDKNIKQWFLLIAKSAKGL